MAVQSGGGAAVRAHPEISLTPGVLGAVAAGIPVLTVAAVLLSPLPLGQAFLWSLLAVSAVLPVLLSPQLRRDAFQPYSLLVTSVLVTVVLPALYVIETRSPTTPTSTYSATVLLFVGSLAFTVLGWVSRSSSGPAATGRLLVAGRHVGEGALRAAVPAAVLLYVVGWGARLARADLGYSHLPTDLGGGVQVVGYLNDLSLGATLSYVVLLGALYRSQGLRSIRWPLVFALVGLEVVGGALNGGRSATALPVLFALLAWSVAIRPIRFRTLVLVYVSALLVVAPVLTAYRAALFAELGNGASPSLDLVAVSAHRTPEVIHDLGGLRRLQAATTSRSASLLESSLRVLDRVPSQVPHEYGKVLVSDIATLLVPRVLYPDKQSVSVGQRRAAQFWDLDPRQSGGTSISIGLPGEMYLNFGWLGIVGFLLFGAFLRSFGDRLAAMPRASVARLSWTVFAYTSVATVDTDLADYLVGLLRTGMVVAGFVLLVTWSTLLTAPAEAGSLTGPSEKRAADQRAPARRETVSGRPATRPRRPAAPA